MSACQLLIEAAVGGLLIGIWIALDSFGWACDERALMDLALTMTHGPVSRAQPVAEARRVQLPGCSGDAQQLLFICEGAHVLL